MTLTFNEIQKSKVKCCDCATGHLPIAHGCRSYSKHPYSIHTPNRSNVHRLSAADEISPPPGQSRCVYSGRCHTQRRNVDIVRAGSGGQPTLCRGLPVPPCYHACESGCGQRLVGRYLEWNAGRCVSLARLDHNFAREGRQLFGKGRALRRSVHQNDSDRDLFRRQDPLQHDAHQDRRRDGFCESSRP
jgi:hypothetical protein